MADNKDFQIGNKAKDLLIYSFTVTKPVSEKTMETKDVLQTMLKLKEMKPEEVPAFCAEAAERLKKSADRQGFPKSTVNTYIRLIRESCVNIVAYIQMANDCRFESEYEKRLALIDDVLKECNLMLQFVLISLELGYINVKRSKHWTKMITDVKYMTLSWKKKDAERAEALRKSEKANEYSGLARSIAAAMKEVSAG